MEALTVNSSVMTWAREHLEDDLSNAIFTDETTVQLESHCRFAYRKWVDAP